MDAIQEKIWDTLVELDAESVARAFTDYHGNCLLDRGFYEFLCDEGYMEQELDDGDDESEEEE